MNVFVVEDAPQVRSRLVALLRAVVDVQVVGEADTVCSAVAGILDTSPDAVLLDLQLPDGNGLDVLAAVKRQRPALRFVVLSNFATPQYRDASLAAGADVFLDKSHDFARLPSILQGWLPPRRGGVPTPQPH